MASTLINEICSTCRGLITTAPISVLLLSVVVSAVGCYVLVRSYLLAEPLLQVPIADLCSLIVIQAYIILAAVSPVPRKPFAEEKTYRTITKDGSVTEPHPLPCWQDTFEEERRRLKIASPDGLKPEPAELFMSVVVPAYNEESRLAGMLEEAVTFLEHAYGNKANDKARSSHANGKPVDLQAQRKQKPRPIDPFVSKEKGWEILIVSDGSTDRTEEIAFSFAREHQLSAHPKAHAGPWSSDTTPREGVRIPPGSIRVIKLAKNRGKGGAVVHGMRHVRGKYVVFADADGASKFDDLSKLVAACQEIEDSEGRGVAVGSRAHMVGSEAVVKVCFGAFLSANRRADLVGAV